MYKNLKVLSFEYDSYRVSFLSKLEDFDKAPYVIKKEKDNLNRALNSFFRSRLIPPMRYNYKEILKATGSKNSFELSFKGHGLSLANPYWFKKEDENLRYEDINFFSNKWDDSFARAILSNNYDALKTYDLNVPDIVTSGWAIKGWLYEDGPKLYKLGMINETSDDCLGEVLASRLACRLLNEGEAVKYELKEINGKYASVSIPFIKEDEELVPLSNILPSSLHDLYLNKLYDKSITKEFFNELKDFEIPNLYEYFVKIQCLKSLCFAFDLHFNNLSVIRNIETNKIRLAPIFDLGGAFGSSKTGHEFLSKIDKGSYIIMYFIFSNLDPDWDYSWYDEKRLVGFENEIKEILSKSEFYTPELIERIIDFYLSQKESLDELASKKSKLRVAHL